MFNSRMTSALLASALVLGSAGAALADGSTSAPNGYRQFIAGATGAAGSAVTVQSAKTTASADNPFALYRRSGDPSNAGTPVVASHMAVASNYVTISPGAHFDRDMVR